MGRLPELEINNRLHRCQGNVISTETNVCTLADGSLLYIITAIIECHIQHHLLFKAVDELNLSIQILNILKENGVTNIGQLIEIEPSALRSFPGMGKRSIDRVKDVLKKRDLCFRYE